MTPTPEQLKEMERAWGGVGRAPARPRMRKMARDVQRQAGVLPHTITKAERVEYLEAKRPKAKDSNKSKVQQKHSRFKTRKAARS